MKEIKEVLPEDQTVQTFRTESKARESGTRDVIIDEAALL